MNDKDVLLDLLDSFSVRFHWIMDGMTLDVLSWQPDNEANNIAVTMWHISRSFDLFKVRLIENRPVEEELWFTEGWASKTGYDPRGKGWSEFGNLAGYTRAEVEEVPILPVDELLQYFVETSGALRKYLESMPRDTLHSIAPGSPAEPQTAYECIRNLLMDGFGHLGEIKAIMALKERKIRAA